MSYVGYTTYEKMSMTEAEKLMQANVEALTSGEGGEVVKCYCTRKIVGKNVCTVGANGGYCGGNPCSNHDGNCRK